MSRLPHDDCGSLMLPERSGQFAAVIERIAHVLRALAFWTAVVLPFLYLPLLLEGLTGQEWIALGGLLAMNVVALVVGHEYARGARV